MKKLCRLLLPASFIVSLGVQAQEHIALSNDEIAQFGITFSPVQELAGNAGIRLSATVINSPLAASAITARYEGIVQAWDVMPGVGRKTANEILGFDTRERLAELLGIERSENLVFVR